MVRVTYRGWLAMMRITDAHKKMAGRWARLAAYPELSAQAVACGGASRNAFANYAKPRCFPGLH